MKDIDTSDALAFYNSQEWEQTRQAVLKLDHYECQRCRSFGRYRKAQCVHHVKHLKDRPDLALAIYDGEERQLVSLCNQCHNAMHPEKGIKGTKKKPITPEWFG